MAINILLKDIGKVMTARKPAVIAYTADLMVDLEKGRIESWDEVIARDKAFMAAA